MEPQGFEIHVMKMPMDPDVAFDGTTLKIAFRVGPPGIGMMSTRETACFGLMNADEMYRFSWG